MVSRLSCAHFILQGVYLLYLSLEICKLFCWPPPISHLMNLYSGFFFFCLFSKNHKITLHCFPFKLLLTSWAKSVLMVVMLTQHLSLPSLVLPFLNKNPFFIHFQFNNQLPQPIQLYPSLMPNHILCGESTNFYILTLLLVWLFF